MVAAGPSSSRRRSSVRRERLASGRSAEELVRHHARQSAHSDTVAGRQTVRRSSSRRRSSARREQSVSGRSAVALAPHLDQPSAHSVTKGVRRTARRSLSCQRSSAQRARSASGQSASASNRKQNSRPVRNYRPAKTLSIQRDLLKSRRDRSSAPSTTLELRTKIFVIASD